MRKPFQKSLSKTGFIFCGRMLLLIAFLCNLSIASAQNTIRGSVADQNGNPLAGVSIGVQGSSAGTISDAQGAFSVNAAGNATLTVNLLGYASQSVAIDGRRQVSIVMQEDVNVLDELVVVGYGTLRKSDITGSISTARGDDVTQSQSFNAVDGLRGKVAGVNIFSNSGQPGSYSRVLIRGINTINSDFQPLYVVDGAVMDNGIDMINPNDIENIEVLKDASSTAIYGARGANGVIIITTKRGKTGSEGIAVSYAGSVTVSTMARKMDVLNAEEWQQVFMQGLANSNKYKGTSYDMNMATHFTDPRYFDSSGRAIYDTDWQDAATRNAVSQNHQLSIQQSGNKSSFGAFLGFTDRQGIMLESYMKRATARMTFDANPKKWLSIGANLSVNHSWGNDAGNEGMGDGGQNALRRIIEMPAWYPVKNTDGSWADDMSAAFPTVVKKVVNGKVEDVKFTGEDGANPVHNLETVLRRRNYTQVFGNTVLTFHINPHLDLQTRLNINFRNRVNRNWGPADVHDFGKSQGGTSSQSNSQNLMWQEETYLTYNNTFNDKHRVNAVLGMSWEEQTAQDFNATGNRFADDYYKWWELELGTDRPSVSSGRSRSAMNSYFFRGNYTYDNRYSVMFTMRADGSSKFGANNKFAFFPSAGLNWNISNEKFMENVRNVDILRLHTSYGFTGNSGISNYQSLSTIGSATSVINNGTVNVSSLSRIANPDLRWEKTGQFDIGVDGSFFNNRISVEASFYHKYTTDLLYNRPIPYETGFANVMSNIGEVSNRGIDFMLRGYPVRNDNFEWHSSLNLNWNKNRIEKIGANNETVWNNWNGTLKVGESLSAFGLYKFMGIESDPTKSTFGRSVISTEREIVGKGLPDWTGAFINTFNYKNFDLTVDFQFTWGVEAYQDFLHSTQSRFLTSGLKTLLNGWTPENPNTTVQMIWNRQYGDSYSDQNVNSSWIADGSFLRLNLIQLGYTFSSNTLGRSGIRALRVYATANNLWLLCSDNYLGFDPENSSKNTERWAQGVEFFSYPKERSFTLGLNITF